MQEIITYKNTKYLISNPKIDARYKTTNLLIETKKKISIKKIIMLITSSYENFFLNLNEYKYINFKKRAEAIAIT